MKENKKDFFVKKDCSLLEAIMNELNGSSKKTAKNYIKHGMILVNDKIETNTNKIIISGSKVTMTFTKCILPDIELKIIYEDKDLIVIDKPAGLLSISNSKEKELTAFRLVSDYVKKQNSKNKIFVVHRLDQETSGVLLFSKNLELKEKLQKEWNNLVKLREYTCVVEGKTEKSGTIKTYLTMNHFQKVYSTRNTEIGKLAITNYKLLKYSHGLSLLKVDIETGRRNQIRVHMSESGHPIIGDKKYGSTINLINRLALHASKLILVDPRTNNILTLKSDVPEQILELV